MTDQAVRVVAAGWYENPSDPTQVRWWNGIAWTDHTQPKPDLGAVATETVEESSGEASALRSRVRSRSTSTFESWTIAFSPLIYLAAVVIVVALNLYTPESVVYWALLAVPYALTVLLGFLDARKLRSWGHTPPSALWGLLGPLVYLIARKLTVAGWGPLGTIIGVLVVGGLLPTALWTTGAAQPLEFALTIQTEIRADLVGSGEATAVACPAIADTMTVGSLYTCDVTMADGAHRTLWVSIDSDDGDYSYSYAIRG